MQLKVTDSFGDISIKRKTSFVHVYGDVDSDGIPDHLDNCPNDYNPLQTDLNSNGTGDTCDATLNRMSGAIFMTRLKSLTAADKNGSDVTGVLSDGLLEQKVELSASTNDAVIIQLNKDARYIRKLLLKFYIGNIVGTPSNTYVYIMPYGSDLVTPANLGQLNKVYAGWNEIDLTALMHSMDNYGSVRFRIAALYAPNSFSLYEMNLLERADDREITAIPESVDFGAIETGKSSNAVLKIRNSGSEALNILKVHLPSLPFTVSTEQCSGKTLGSPSFCEISVVFSPASNSSFSDILRIDSSDADISSLRVNLKGTGTLILNGTVKDAVTGYPLNGVTVTVVDSSRTTTHVTDVNGNYSISGMPMGDYTATFNISDYHPLTLKGSIRQEGNNRLDAALSYNYATIGGIVKDQSTGTPLPGVAVTLSLTGFRSKNPADIEYACAPSSSTLDFSVLKSNDGLKTVCGDAVSSSKTSLIMRARNPFGLDPFTVTWNGIGSLAGDNPEYLAQSFKPGRSGKLTRVSFFTYGTTESVGGYIRVLLKNKLGGDRGSYLAVSNWVGVKSAVGVSKWVDFDFPSPVDLVAGQEYFIEINGTYFLWAGTSGYLYNLYWGNADLYPNGKGYKRINGIWTENSLPLAFQTFIDGQIDTSAQLSTYSIGMYGGNTASANGYVKSTNGDVGIPLPIDRLALDNDGEYGYNGDDLTAKGTYSNNLGQFYDAKGWVTATMSAYSLIRSALATDQFTIEFNRTLTAVTDATGGFSFSSLPEGNYVLTLNKAAYTGESISGQLAIGQNLFIDRGMSLAPPATLSGSIKGRGNNSVIAGAAITITDPIETKSGVSDSLGNYMVSGIFSGDYSATISANGYISQTITGTLAPAQMLQRDIVLDPSPINLILTSPATTVATVYSSPFTISGKAENADRVYFTTSDGWGEVSHPPVQVVNGEFSIPVSLADGENYITLWGENDFGAVSTRIYLSITFPPFILRNLGDTGNVTVMEYSDRYNYSSGTLPGTEIAREYIRSHGDKYDFLVFLSTFNHPMPNSNAKAYYQWIKNDVKGTGLTIFDSSNPYGSSGKLQGTIDLGSISTLAATPYGPKLDDTVMILNHELNHRWGSYVRFKNPDGTLNYSLLGNYQEHWSYLIDSKGSVMYGSGWKDNGDGTFTATSTMNGYSPLDLYLMGMVPKEQVPPMLLIDNPAIDKNQLPQLGATISGTPKTVTIDDIIAAEGPRIPDSGSSQKKFNVGFILLVRPGDSTAAAVSAVETLRTAWAGRFAELTRGVGSMEGVAPALTLNIESPTDAATITGPDVTVTGTIINSTGVETGVSVNGIPATVTGTGFVANHVPLTEGANTLTITATDANGLTAAATRIVTAQAGHYVRISSNIDSGTGPLEVSLRINGSFSSASYARSASGPVPVMIIPGISPEEFSAKLTAEGTYTFTASAKGPDGQTYSDSVTVTVVNRWQLESLLKKKWEGMKQKIATLDVEGAVSFLATSYQDQYRQIFTALGARLPVLSENLPPVQLVYATEERAKCRVSRVETVLSQQKMVTYQVYFIRENGVWKLIKY